MSNSPYIFDITAENFEQIVINGSFEAPILVDFWADWCQPCKMLMPVLAKLAEEYAGKFILAKVNTEEQQAVAMQFGIRSIPTVKLFHQGRELDEFAGALPEAEVRAFLDRHLPSAANDVLVAAEQMIAAGDAAGALQLLAPAQAADPNDYAILIAMAKAHAALGDWDTASQVLGVLPANEALRPEVVMLSSQMHFAKQAPRADEIDALQARLQADPKDSEARFKLAIAQVMQNDFAGAIDALLMLMMKDRSYGEDAARQTLLKLFDMLGDDPMVAQARRRMFNLMH